MKLAIKVVPGSSHDRIAGWLGESLKVRVKAAPEAGKANKAVVKLIAEAVGVGLARVSIIGGSTSPWKVIEIEGIDAAEVLCLLEKSVS